MDDKEKMRQIDEVTDNMISFTILLAVAPKPIITRYHSMFEYILHLFRKEAERLDMLKPGDFERIERTAKDRAMSNLKKTPSVDLPAKGWDGNTLPIFTVGNSGAIWEVFATSDKTNAAMIEKPPEFSSEYYKARCADPRDTSTRIGTVTDLHWSLLRGDNVQPTLADAIELANDSDPADTFRRQYV